MQTEPIIMITNEKKDKASVIALFAGKKSLSKTYIESLEYFHWLLYSIHRLCLSKSQDCWIFRHWHNPPQWGWFYYIPKAKQIVQSLFD